MFFHGVSLFCFLRGPGPAVPLPASFPHFSTLNLPFYPEDGGPMFLQNASKHLLHCTVLHLRINKLRSYHYENLKSHNNGFINRMNMNCNELRIITVMQ
jgi:hypothetical protein